MLDSDGPRETAQLGHGVVVCKSFLLVMRHRQRAALPSGDRPPNGCGVVAQFAYLIGLQHVFFFKLYSHFNVWTGTQPSIRVRCIDKRAWLSLALCEGCSHGGTSELALSRMFRVEEN